MIRTFANQDTKARALSIASLGKLASHRSLRPLVMAV
jgi:hypothetical protein